MTYAITISFQPLKMKLFRSKNKSLLVIESSCINGATNRIKPGNKALVHVRQSSYIPAGIANDVVSLAASLFIDKEKSGLDYLEKGCWVNIQSKNLVVLRAQANIELNRRGDRLIECIELIVVINNNGDKHLPTNMDNEYNELIVGDDTATDSNPIQVKSQRHEIFAQWIVETFGRQMLSKGTGVIDVAGGNGRISKALSEMGVQSTLLDPNPRCYSDQKTNDDDNEHSVHSLPFKVIALPLNGDGSDLTCRNDEISDTIKNCSLICGLHPDQATEPIVTLALRLNVPFAIA